MTQVKTKTSNTEFTALKQLKETTTNISQLNEKQTRQLQQILQELDYYTGAIDGIVGNLTRNALKHFKNDQSLAYPHKLGTTTVKSLISEYKAHNDLLPNVESKNRDGVIDAVIDSCDAQGLSLTEQKAYVLATIEHETNNTFKPVREAYWLSEQWRRNNLRYYPYYGRGFIQLTWKSNYAKYEQTTGEPLVESPDLVMDYDLSVFICVHGMANGIFTGHALPSFVNADQVDYYNARKVVNALDKAERIANLAQKWQRNL